MSINAVERIVHETRLCDFERDSFLPYYNCYVRFKVPSVTHTVWSRTVRRLTNDELEKIWK